MRAESAATGKRSTRWFHGLSRGNTGQRGAPGRRAACAAGASARRARTARRRGRAGRCFTRPLSAREAGDPRGGGGPPAREWLSARAWPGRAGCWRSGRSGEGSWPGLWQRPGGSVRRRTGVRGCGCPYRPGPSPGRGAGDRAGARGLADDGHAEGGLGEGAGTGGHGGLLGAAALAGAADVVGVDCLGDGVLHEGGVHAAYRRIHVPKVT